MNLKSGDRIRITGYDCGRCAKKRLSTMGLLKGKECRILNSQPFQGPVVLECGQIELAIGRGLFSKITYEVIENDNTKRS